MGLLRLHSMLGLDKAATIQKTLSLELHEAMTFCKTTLLKAKTIPEYIFVLYKSNFRIRCVKSKDLLKLYFDVFQHSVVSHIRTSSLIRTIYQIKVVKKKHDINDKKYPRR